MPYKAIVCDMDETLLDDNHILSQRNIDAIVQAREKYSIKFIPSTGRGFFTIQNELKLLGLYNQPNEYVISNNGAIITENKENRLLLKSCLPFDTAKILFTFGIQNHLCMHVSTVENLYIFNISESEKKRKAGQKINYIQPTTDSIDFLSCEPIIKLAFQHGKISFLKALEKDIHALLPAQTVTYSSNRYMEFSPSDVNKGNGLKKLAGLLDIDLKDIVAIGDNFNDIPMLTCAGFAVTPQNAVPEAKACCNYITDSTNNNHAVAEFIEKFIIQ